MVEERDIEFWEHTSYNLARYIVDELPYDDFNLNGYNDLTAWYYNDGFIMKNKDFLELLQIQYDIMKMTIENDILTIYYKRQAPKTYQLVRDEEFTNLWRVKDGSEKMLELLFYYQMAERDKREEE